MHLAGRNERAVLAALVGWAGRTVSSDRLEDALWAESPPRSAPKIVQNVVLRLRKRLGAEMIETRPGGYALRAADDTIDARRFEQLIGHGRAAAAAAEWDAAVSALVEALDLWRGSPLAELADWPPAQGEAVRLDELHRGAEEELAELQLQRGCHREWVPVLEALVAEGPLRERCWRSLMLALYRCGRHADALRAFQRARAALAEAGLEPAHDLVQLERRIAIEDPALLWDGAGGLARASIPHVSAKAKHGNLARPMTVFVGRSAELAEKAAELTVQRLITFAGPGGVGKTRLAIECGWARLDAFFDGAWFVDLDAVNDPGAVLPAVAATLSVPRQAGSTLRESVLDWLRGRRVLLIVDNCEHVLEAAAEVVDDVLTHCPGATVLATSRQPLGVPGERVHRVAPLEPSIEGVELCCARVQAADDRFDPTPAELGDISAICRHLDGLPLAIELAATRITTLGAAGVLEHLDDRLGLLRTSESSRRPDRHKTLHAAVLWSYDLLDPSARVVFERLSVFKGSFGLAAAKAVCGATFADSAEVVDAVGLLVDASMVVTARTPSGTRYRLLETLRRFGHERLVSSGGLAEVRDRHLAYYIDASLAMRKVWASPHQLRADAFFELEWDNLRAAHGWAISARRRPSAEELILATAPHAFCRHRTEHGEWALAAAQLGALRSGPAVASHGWAAYWICWTGDPEQAVALARRGIAAALVADHADTIWCWSALTVAHLASDDSAEARQAAQRALSAASTSTDPLAAVWALRDLANVDFDADPAAAESDVDRFAALARQIAAPSLLAEASFFEGRTRLWIHRPQDQAGALRLYREGVEWARAVGDIRHENVNMIGLVFAETVTGDPGLGPVLAEAMSRFYETRDWMGIWISLVAIASWLERTGAIEPAVVIYGHLRAHRRPFRDIDGTLQRLRSPAEHPGAEAMMSAGARMDGHQIVTYLIEQLAPAAERRM